MWGRHTERLELVDDKDNERGVNLYGAVVLPVCDDHNEAVLGSQRRVTALVAYR